MRIFDGDRKIWLQSGALVIVISVLTIVGLFILPKGNPSLVPVTEVGQVCSGTCQDPALVCRQGRCEMCVSDQDCLNERPNTICLASSQECRHKQLLPIQIPDILTCVLSIVIMSIAAAGGSGGGGCLVSLFILLNSFIAHEAIPLSRAAVFGGSIYNFIYFFPLKHPTADRPRIDFDLILLLEPMTLAGSTIGVLMNQVFPEWLILFLVVICLSTAGYRTAKRGYELWHAEESLGYEEDEGLLQSTPPMKKILSESDKRELNMILEAEKDRFPIYKIMTLLGLFVFMFLTFLLRGGREGGLVQCGSPAYWLVFVMVFPVCVGVVSLFSWRMHKLHARKIELGYPFQRGDIEWSGEKSVSHFFLCIGGSIFSGILGVSGGTMKGPVMLELGILPQVQSATSTFMGLMTSSLTTLQFVIFGDLEYGYALFFMATGFIATVIGQNGIGWLVERYNKTAFIAIALALILCISTILIGYAGAQDIVNRAAAHQPDGFRSLC